MREKNIKLRQEIDRIAYRKFSVLPYKDVFLKDIAEEAGIKKSLLQYYHPQKHSLMAEMMEELLWHSFNYVDGIVEKEENIHVKLAVYTSIFWMSCDIDERFDMFLFNAFNAPDVYDHVMEEIYVWLCGILKKNRITVDLNNLKISLEFAVAGGMRLYYKRDSLNLTTNEIMKEVSITFMRMMGCTSEERFQNIQKTEAIVESVDLNDFLSYCEENIVWYSRS